MWIHSLSQALMHNFTVDAQELNSDNGEVISSSRIRTLVIEGKVEDARLLLGRPHRLDGVVVHGEKRGREIGYPTANLGNIDGQDNSCRWCLCRLVNRRN